MSVFVRVVLALPVVQHSTVKNDCLSASFSMNAIVELLKFMYLFHLDELVAVVFCGKDMDTF